MDPVSTLRRLQAKMDQYNSKARKTLDRATIMDVPGRLKVRVVSETEKLHRKREQMERYAQDGRLSPAAKDRLAAQREAVLNEVQEELEEFREKVDSQYGLDSLPPEPVSESAHRRLSLLVAQLDRMDDEELAEHVSSAALEGDRATTQTLAPEVQRRLRDTRFDDLPDHHPLSIAKRSLEVAESNHQTVLKNLAQEEADRLEGELETVIRTVQDRGRWTGPAATAMDGNGRRASTPSLPVAGPAERAAYERYVDPEDRSAQVAEATEDLPTVDPILPLNDDTPDPAEAREARMRDRIQNRGG